MIDKRSARWSRRKEGGLLRNRFHNPRIRAHVNRGTVRDGKRSGPRKSPLGFFSTVTLLSRPAEGFSLSIYRFLLGPRAALPQRRDDNERRWMAHLWIIRQLSSSAHAVASFTIPSCKLLSRFVYKYGRPSRRNLACARCVFICNVNSHSTNRASVNYLIISEVFIVNIYARLYHCRNWHRGNLTRS